MALDENPADSQEPTEPEAAPRRGQPDRDPLLVEFLVGGQEDFGALRVKRRPLPNGNIRIRRDQYVEESQ